MKQSKIWGTTNAVFIGNNSETHYINAVSGGYSSKHKHEYKYNLFYVINGSLTIEIYRENGVVDSTTIYAGQSTVVPPNVYHRFTAEENTDAIEVYWVELKTDDIIREDQGGIDIEHDTIKPC